MPDTDTYKGAVEAMKKYGIYADKRLGQNFLVDRFVIGKIIKHAGVCKEDFVIEIGAGLGAMTKHLAENAKKVVSIEIDNRLFSMLREEFSEYDNIVFINGDILKIDLVKIINDENIGGAVKIVANLPYYITTPIIMSLIENNRDIIDSITVMVQKEVAERIVASSGTKNYGALSLAVAYRCDAEIVAAVPVNCFIPRPTVDSAVVKLSVLKNPKIDCTNEDILFKIIRASFSQRRKTLVNAVFNQCGFNLDKDEIANLICLSGFSKNVRGEAVDLNGFCEISNHFAGLI